MKNDLFEIQSKTPFSESLLWQLNRDFYQEKGITAWSDDIVPHHMTSNSKVGRTYAELILALLKDLAAKGKTTETVYMIELGAGHGRLAFHILKHLEKLVTATIEALPPFCYILSDIVEANLNFFQQHPQFQSYMDKGILDVAYFDAIGGEALYLRHAKKTILPQDLNQPILAIANYFFDSIPNDLFFIQDKLVAACSVAIHSKENPKAMNTEKLIDKLDVSFHQTVVDLPFYQEPIFDAILEDYKNQVSDSYLFFPKKSMICLQQVKAFSKAGLVLLTMDKGVHELENLKRKNPPDIITHGSLSIWVNYHALTAYCVKQGGKALFPSFSNFHLEIGCLLFLEDSETYVQTDAAYQRFVNDFGPDDYNSMKQLAYFNISRLKLVELLALIRMNDYDSTFFIKLLPRLKSVYKTMTKKERSRLAQTMDGVWDMYFNINEKIDLAYEIGGMLYDMGYYSNALTYFQHSVDGFGMKADIYYNQVLCYYQLRQDDLFYQTLTAAKAAYPEYTLYGNLEQLDMG